MWARTIIAGLLVLGSLLAGRQAFADRLELIDRRGTLIVGVKSDYPPFGMLDAKGALIGLEPDLAALIAAKLGAELQLVSVSATNRLQKLEDGSIDLVIATLGDTAQRRQIATLIEPNYYASGVTLMARSDRKVTDWADLRGQKICATQGALFNKPMAQRHLLDLQIFNGTRDAKLALRDGRCVGWLFDDTAIASELRNPEWAGYHMPLPSTMISPWSMAIARSERGSEFERFLSDTIARWHRDGTLIDIEKRWGIKPSSFLAQTHDLWNSRTPDGAPVCHRQDDGNWPAECRNKALLTPQDVDGLHRIGLLVKEEFGLDLSLIYDRYDRGQFLNGLYYTLLLVIICLTGSFAFGVVGALIMDARIPVVSKAARGLGAFARMTPPLLHMYIVLFGIGSFVAARYGWSLSNFAVAAFCLSLYAGAAIAFTLVEVAGVIGGPDADNRFCLTTLPRVMRLAYGPVAASLVNIVKGTGMASAIAVPELIASSTAIIAEQGNANVMINVLLVMYFLIVLIVVRLFGFAGKRLVSHAAH